MGHLPSTAVFAALVGLASAGLSACASDTRSWGPSASLPASLSKPASDTPGLKRVVGPFSGLVCNDRYDPKRAQTEALKRLQARALAEGATDVFGVRFSQITNTRSPCWHGTEATGFATTLLR